MYLKSLRLQGFKSFPEAICIEFHQGVTAIVGPNGSGKSNVTDAIRWVLGEQSVRSLRGSKMEDVIFNGTESRRKLSTAEVSICFDNRDHTLAIDYDQVEVTRRYYRSGDSEYLLNQKTCRLKDILTLFADTGIGRDGYSIIGQGRVDEILSERGDEKRRIFDEAAGIVKFKMRKQESLSRLEKADQNLLRLKDILGEVEERIGPLESQAEKAKAFRQLQNEWREKDIQLSLLQISHKEQEITEADENNQDLQAEQRAASHELALLQERSLSIENKLQNSDRDLDEQRGLLNQAELSKTKLAEEDSYRQEKRQALLLKIAEQKKSLEQLASRLLGLEQDQEARLKHAEQLKSSRQRYAAELSSEEQALSLLLAELNEREVQRDQQKAALDDERERQFSLRQTLGQYRTERGMLSERLGQVQVQLDACTADRNRQTFILEDAADLVQNLQRSWESQSKLWQELQAAGLGARRSCEEVERALQQDQDQARQLQFRHEALASLAADHEGYHPAVRSLMQAVAKGEDWTRGLIGPLGDLIAVPERYEKAIEIALGNMVHHLLVEDRQTAKRLISWLKEQRAGRETFLPLDNLRPEYLREQQLARLHGQKGFIAVAAELVQIDAAYQDALDFCLAKIVVAEDLEQALRLSDLLDKRVRIITLAGEQVNPGGSMTGGENKNQRSGLISRQRELKALAQALEIKQDDCKRQEAALDEARTAFLSNAQKEEEAQKVLDKLKIEQVQAVSNEQLERQKGQQLLEQLASLEHEQADLSAKLKGVDEQIAQAEEGLETSQEHLIHLQDELDAQSKAKRSDYEQRDLARERMADLRVSLSSIDESLHAVEALNEHLHEEQTRIIAEQTELERALVQQAEEERMLAEEHAAFAGHWRETQQRIQVLEDKIRAALLQKEELYAARRDNSLQQQSCQQNLQNLALQTERCQQRLERCSEQLQELKSHLWEVWQISYAQALEYPSSELGLADLQRICKKLKQEIQELGLINPAAEDEYAVLHERLLYLRQQENDLEQSRHGLERLIQDLEREMRTQFEREFAQINENFQKVFAELFVGGRAELSLNSADVLQAGIDIMAQPPGKKLQSLSLLSGGERSLTAIALLFAIFQLRPAPFCVLDEVESALDDANVLRFTDYIRHYTERTQFILVTHRKGTMEGADRLYGVTMKERGVSNILSLALEQENE